MLHPSSHPVTRRTTGRQRSRARRWPFAPGDGFQLIAIAFTVALGALTWALLAASG